MPPARSLAALPEPSHPATRTAALLLALAPPLRIALEREGQGDPHVVRGHAWIGEKTGQRERGVSQQGRTAGRGGGGGSGARGRSRPRGRPAARPGQARPGRLSLAPVSPFS